MFNELAERNTREEEENGEISPRALHVKRKDLTSLFGRKDTMDEITSGGKLRNHGLRVAIPDEGTGEALGGMSMG
jgi:propanediol utilization protein